MRALLPILASSLLLSYADAPSGSSPMARAAIDDCPAYCK